MNVKVAICSGSTLLPWNKWVQTQMGTGECPPRPHHFGEIPNDLDMVQTILSVIFDKNQFGNLTLLSSK